MEISVIIATRNRSEALETISLPSLAKQEFKDFEVVIWDASDDDRSKVVVETFMQYHHDMLIRYFKAPRVGSASQRNDAVKVAVGNIIFFIDDDSEVSQDGLLALLEAFRDGSVCGAGLFVTDLRNSKEVRLSFKKKAFKAYTIIFRMSHEGKNNKVMLSGWNIYTNHRNFGEVEWLGGCSMAYRKELFEKFSFNEELQKFGGYAFGEDLEFSHRIARSKKKEKLLIIKKGYIIHHGASGGRFEKENKIASVIYNHFIIWRTAIFPYDSLSVFVFLWSLAGELLLFYSMGIIKRDKIRLRGASIGLKAIINSFNRRQQVL